MLVACDGDEAVGFVSVKVHNPRAAEIYVMGVMEPWSTCR